MAGKDPKKLREQVKKLLAEAERIESDRHIKIGKLTLKYFGNGQADFSDVEIVKFREELNQILGE